MIALAEPQPIKRLLVANRGEIARRVMRTCREMGISTVAVFSEPDAGAAFVREADVAVALGGSSPADSYLRGDAVIEAARTAGADAIHPGYGFLAENAGFAAAVADAGITWIGPPPAAIDAMGSKVNARSAMQAAGVPVVPGAELEDGLGADGLASAAREIGFPIMVKASAGGGGKGMRIVETEDELVGAVEAAGREASAAFGDGTVFLERYVTEPRHVEIQVFADDHGNVVSLHERECSIQRRHQKVIEEAPSPAVDADLRARMGEAAVAAARAVDYRGAGTIEFLMTSGGEFFFLEMNTRLQVEHPVTECITGLDLVRLQIEVAEGRELPEEALEPTLAGHAVEARLYAEDPAARFLPQTGILTRFGFGDGVRVDTGVEDGAEISPHYDPMLAKVIACAPSREEAIRKLADAMARARLHGLVTNRDFLVRVLRHDEFIAGRTDTHFLERHEGVGLTAPLIDRDLEALCATAAALERQARNRASAGVLRTLPSGFRNVRSSPQSVSYEGPHGEHEIAYAFDARGRLALLSANSSEADAELVRCEPGAVDLIVGGVRRRFEVAVSGGRAFVDTAEGGVELRELSRFPDPDAHAAAGSLLSPMPGAVLRVLVSEGDPVEKGRPLLVIEAMKMEHEIVAPGDGTVSELPVAEGAQVESGAVLAVITGDDE